MPGRKGTKAAPDKAENQAKQNAEMVEEIDENESKAPIEAKVEEAKADADGEEAENKEPSTKKSGRGRPKKAGGEQPVAKKPKAARVMSKPSRVSQRVSNQKKGVKMVKEDGIRKAPKKRTSKKTDNPSKDVSEPDEEEAATSNGAAEQTVES